MLDWNSHPCSQHLLLVKRIFENGPGEAHVTADIPDQLTEHGMPLSSVTSIIWSHSHIDHVGDPSLFPPSVTLLIGPGTPRPGYPTDPDAFLLDSAFESREVRELDFSNAEFNIGGFRAIDYFEDGSFYLLSAPGHCVGHVMGLARTSSSSEDAEWILMAGDACHHVGQLRPSIYVPFPDGPLYAKFKALLPKGVTEPFYRLPEHLHHHIEQARETVAKVQVFDANDRVLVILAHDRNLLGLVVLYPQALNGWRERGWGAEEAKWRFLEEDMREALELVDN